MAAATMMAGQLGDLADRLERELGERVQRNVSSAELTTYRVGGPLAVLVRAGHVADLEVVASIAALDDVEVLVIGRGSNLLVSDRGFAGLAIVLEGEFESLAVDVERRTARAGAAAALPVVARRTAALGVSGLEFFVGIPGSVGGAVRMNAGGHGRETRDVLVRAQIVDLRSGTASDREASSLALGYRRSSLGVHEIVTGAVFVGRSDEPATCEERIAEIVTWRREHQPGGANAGSIFRNPLGDSAGRLIDACGLKGTRVGGAVVSPKHANFFQAEPGSSAGDVFRLVAEVQAKVAAETGIELEPELRLIGFEEGVR